MGRKSGFSDLRVFPGFLEKKIGRDQKSSALNTCKNGKYFLRGRNFFFFAICLKNTLSTLENRLEGLRYGKRSGKVVFPNLDFFFFFATLAIFFPQMEYAVRICWYLTILFSQKIRP